MRNIPNHEAVRELERVDADLEEALGYCMVLLDHIDCDHGGDHPMREELFEYLNRFRS